MTEDRSSNDACSNTETSSAVNDQRERTDDHWPTRFYRSVKPGLASLELPDALVVMGSGALGALFTGFAAQTSAYWVESFKRFPIYIPPTYRLEEVVFLSVTLGIGVALVKTSYQFQRGTGQLAAIVGSVLISLLVVFTDFPQPLLDHRFRLSRIVFKFDFLYYDPVLTTGLVAYLTRPRGRGTTTGEERKRCWLHLLFSVGNYERVLLVSVGTSIVFFGAIYLLTWLNNPTIARDYLDPTGYLRDTTYFGSLLITFELIILGKWVANYPSIWKAVEDCFATDENWYEEFVRKRIERMYNPRTVFISFTVLWVYFFVPQNFDNQIPELCFTAVIVFLGITIIDNFYVHVRTVEKSLEFGFDNVYTAAQKLEPLTQFAVNTAFWWFATISVFVIIGIFDSVSGIGNLAPFVLWLGPLILVGFAVVAIPTWQIHVALTSAKNDLLSDVYARQNETISKWTTHPSSHKVNTELNAAKLAYESASRVRTWPYDVDELVKVLVSSSIPIGRFLWDFIHGLL